MKKPIYAIGGLAAGAALMYWLDPLSGRRRRSVARGRAEHLAREARRAIDVTRYDLRHRARGLLEDAVGRLEERPIDDVVLHERVRAALGRVCSHPHSLETPVTNGIVTLRGPVLAREVREIRSRITRVPGIKAVDDRLEVFPDATDVPALQGGPTRRMGRFELLQERWAPAPRFVAGAAGAALVGAGLAARRSALGVATGLTGAALLLRAATNLPLRRLVGIGAGRRAVEIVKEIQVNAPVEEVFSFFRAFENFPRFMTHVEDVRRLAEGRTRWTIAGPAGIPITCECEVTEVRPNRLVAWRSTPGSFVRCEGTILFERLYGGTRLNIRMGYNPPGGAIGHALLELFGADPKKLMDDDLVRFKSLIETGKATGRAETVTKEELRSLVPFTVH
ncbi:MAG: SRPBCC family protein [Deltaproteobacteria bacterium]|nr:SRPBCC family protein [Deltaproteobacteria bacterium]